MIGSAKSPFHIDSTEKGLSLKPYLDSSEEIAKAYKNMNMYAFFTNKRIIFTYTKKPADETTIEFVPYQSIVRLAYLDSEELNTYNVEIHFPDCIVLQFSFSNQSEAISLIKLIESHICL